jgi:hypothetical protein
MFWAPNMLGAPSTTSPHQQRHVCCVCGVCRCFPAATSGSNKLCCIPFKGPFSNALGLNAAAAVWCSDAAEAVAGVGAANRVWVRTVWVAL